MTISQILLLDFEAEAENTRRVLERVPDENMTWKPHEKSFALGNMAFHVATLPNFGNTLLSTDNMDLAAKMGNFPRYAGEGSQALLAMYDQAAAALRSTLAGMTDDELQANWTMTFGERTIADGPRMLLYRTMFFNHLIHHRGQLNVYLRLLGVAVPGIYGPSADEPFGG
jgi:uncharacterized damage-inducible protein DinB